MADPDIAAEIDELCQALVAGARARQAELALDEEALAFAVLLAGKRAEWARRHLTAEPADRPFVAGWLEVVLELGQAHLAEAQSAEEVEDAALSALDSLHSYLLAHELVGPGYLEEEQAFCDELFPEFSERGRLLADAVQAAQSAAAASRSAQDKERALPEAGQQVDDHLAAPLG